MSPITRSQVRFNPRVGAMMVKKLGNAIISGSVQSNGSRIIFSPAKGQTTFWIKEPRFTAEVERVEYTRSSGTFRLYGVKIFTAKDQATIRGAKKIIVANQNLCTRWQIKRYLVVQGGSIELPGIEIKVVDGFNAHLLTSLRNYLVHDPDEAMDFRLFTFD